MPSLPFDIVRGAAKACVGLLDGLGPIASGDSDSYRHRADGGLTVFFRAKVLILRKKKSPKDPESA
jgi:hypothetical protein